MSEHEVDEIAPTLKWLLRVAGDEWGPLGVAIAAADRVGRNIVVAALTKTDFDRSPVDA